MKPHNDLHSHKECLFGRDDDVRLLLEYSKGKGLSAVVSRPKMGKTWLLEEVGRILFEEKGYLVGYHESKMSSDHLLRCISSLYVNWLANSTYFQQAKIAYSQHKDQLITGTGVAIGKIFKTFAGCVPSIEELGVLVSETFNGLARTQEDLKTGGLSIAPISYDVARDLVSTIAKVSGGKPIVLILDAWEQSLGIDAEYITLAGFLAHLQDWPLCHVFLGLRQPHLDTAEGKDRAYIHAQDLSQSSISAKIFPLQPMDLRKPDKFVTYLRSKVPILKSIPESQILALVEGFPGVVERWTDSQSNFALQTPENLRITAEDAQKYRYREFDVLFPLLTGDKLSLAIQLAFFPRLDQSTWPVFKPILLRGVMKENIWFDLNTCGVLEGDAYPTFGHDTRHMAARRWWLERKNYRPVMVNEIETLISRLAQKWQRMHETSRPFAEALRGLRYASQQIPLSDSHHALLEAAESMFSDRKDVNWKILTSGLELGTEVAPIVAQALVNRGLTYGRAGKADNAIPDYTAVIEMQGATPEQKARALVNRGVTYGQAGKADNAKLDWIQASKIPSLSPKLRILIAKLLDEF